jgi:aspartyl-tRNA(Asn)/glutamyl-tRNA(Gln) amidotransferase subunit A
VERQRDRPDRRRRTGNHAGSRPRPRIVVIVVTVGVAAGDIVSTPVTVSNPASLTIVDAARRLRDGSLTSAALTDACLARIARDNERLNAFILVTADAAREQAAAADRELASGQDRGALHGIPIALKDIVDVEGLPTTCASRVREGHVAEKDAVVVAHLRRAGAVFIGKTNLHEFAMGTTNEDSAYGAARHPHDDTRSPGGSSGGSAIAVTCGMSLGAVGTDTGGSIRIPASVCGLVGIKPAFNELSCDGVVPLSRSLDHVGPLARTLTDAWLLYDVMAGREAPLNPPPATAAGAKSAAKNDGDPASAMPASMAMAKPRRAAIPSGYFIDRLQPDVRRGFDEAVAWLRGAGVQIEHVELPHADAIAPVYLHICLAEAAAYHARSLETMGDAYTSAVRMRFEAGRFILAEDYLRALAGRDRLRAGVSAALASHQLLLLPTLPIVAPPIGAATVPMGDSEEPVRAAMLRLTQPFNLTGHPALTLPIRPASGGLPVGLQLVGSDTRRLLAAAAWCERQLQP